MKLSLILNLILFTYLCQNVYSQTNCESTWQCSELTNDYNYVECLNNVCKCRDKLGFTGSATSQDKCNCPFPKYVIWKDSSPYCVNLQNITHDASRREIMKSKVRKVYTNFLNPTARQIVKNLSLVSDLFRPDVRGRVMSFGRFNNFVLPQYYYGLGATANATNVVFTTLIAENNVVSVRADVQLFRNPQAFFQPEVFNISQVGFFYFDKDNMIAGVDVNFINLGRIQDVPSIPVVQDQIHDFYRQDICTLLMSRCNSTNQQFSSFNECFSFLSSIPVGSWAQLQGNNLYCRLLHATILRELPSGPQAEPVHCPHIGPTGGMACVELPISDYYTNDVVNVWA